MVCDGVCGCRVTIVRDKHSRESKGVAFVAFKESSSVTAAIAARHKQEVHSIRFRHRFDL
jgi:hypothetical protein